MYPLLKPSFFPKESPEYLPYQLKRKNEGGESHRKAEIGGGQRNGSQHASAEIDERDLYRRYGKHYGDKGAISRKPLEKTERIGTRVEAIKHSRKDKESKKCGQVGNTPLTSRKARGYKIGFEEKHANGDGKRSEAGYLIYHITVQDRLIARFWLLTHTGRQRRLTRERDAAKGIHNHVYPKHLRNGYGRLYRDKRTDHSNANGTEIYRQLEHDEFADALENISSVKHRFDY